MSKDRFNGCVLQDGTSDYSHATAIPTSVRLLRLQPVARRCHKVRAMHAELTSSSASQSPPTPRQQRLRAFLSDAGFPCVGAKSALNKDRIVFADYPSLSDPSVAADLCGRLGAFANTYPDPGDVPVSFIAMFGGPVQGELEFEQALWTMLQALHEHDRAHFEWDSTVGSDPMQSDFSLSIAERAFFVVGLHPGASRLARRAPFPCLVFNFHNQFEQLKASGRYQSMQNAIRSRELQLQGSINPVLARFGKASEARQYAGRAVESGWRCPFHAEEGKRHV